MDDVDIELDELELVAAAAGYHYYNSITRQPSRSSTPKSTPLQILESNRFYPYFEDCIGVIDGMRIPAHVPAKDQSRFRNKKGILTQNVLAACTFDLQFIFVYPGWEGSATDSRLLRAVLDDPDQNFPPIPEGKYYLVDTVLVQTSSTV
ncbi:hypothetical protein K7X08_013285 [Anisodus acutangulus]|uniref:DDE Tnp4 domain-containing protein n=1 Tax=Anisodus acutangulus TaxID=402998 RepID=A0A9Q1ME56_9SOLA|nr:hypothetical protein K7X08_013285 [Anisodus acutangulus]